MNTDFEAGSGCHIHPVTEKLSPYIQSQKAGYPIFNESDQVIQ